MQNFSIVGAGATQMHKHTGAGAEQELKNSEKLEPLNFDSGAKAAEKMFFPFFKAGAVAAQKWRLINTVFNTRNWGPCDFYYDFPFLFPPVTTA